MRFVLKNAPALPEEFDFEFVKFRDGKYHFQHELNLSFFDAFEGSEVSRAGLAVQAVVEKNLQMIQVDLTISGTVGMSCHRCLEIIDFNSALTHKLIFELVPEQSRDVNAEFSEDILELVRVPHTATKINYARQIYELVVLDVPMIRNCDMLEIKPCNSEMLQKLEKLNNPEKGDSDPRWDKLKELFKK